MFTIPKVQLVILCASQSHSAPRVLPSVFYTTSQTATSTWFPFTPTCRLALFQRGTRDSRSDVAYEQRAQDARSRRGRARGRHSRVTSPAGRRKGPKVVAFFRPHVSARARQRERERGRKRPEEPRGRRLERVLEMSQRTRGQTDSRGASASRTQRNLFEK